MEKIGIFCSASENIDKMYFESARQIGEWMGQKGKTLIYGGASLGLMECVARAVKENGGKVIGVVPAKLEENGKVSTLLDEEIHTRNLSDRKDIITQASFIQRKLFSNIFRIKEIVMRMFELIPVPVITDFLLVLFTKSLPFYAITFRKHTDAHRSRFNLLLLKKRRTQN